MSRLLWFAAGAASSAYAVLRARRAAEALTPDGLRDRAGALRLGAALFGEELRTEMTLRETELRERLGLDVERRPEIGAPTAPLELTREGDT